MRKQELRHAYLQYTVWVETIPPPLPGILPLLIFHYELLLSPNIYHDAWAVNLLSSKISHGATRGLCLLLPQKSPPAERGGKLKELGISSHTKHTLANFQGNNFETLLKDNSSFRKGWRGGGLSCLGMRLCKKKNMPLLGLIVAPPRHKSNR